MDVPMATITLDGIGKSYGSHTVLHDLSLEVAHGECFTLLGPSGCGKTVLLRLIAGFETPSSGTIRIGDALVSDAASGDSTPPNERDLGVVFQEYAVWPHMTVFENIAYPLKLAKTPKDELKRRVMETVEQVNLTGLENRMPSQLSGGQQQRVALARALTARPSLLLLDEPLCNLDANLREEMRFEIKDLQRTLGITILYVTHDQEIALAISDRIAIMDEAGTIRQIGTPWDIFEKPADNFVFSFMGVANFLPVHLQNGACIVDGGEQVCPWQAPVGGSRYVGGFRPSDVALAREGAGLRGVVRRASFLGAMTDYLIEVDGNPVRTQLETHEALSRNLMFREGESCTLTFHDLHWFDAATSGEDR